MNAKKTASLLSVFAILLIVLTACAANLQEQIIGQWELSDENVGITLLFVFKEDGDLTIWLDDVPLEAAYTWLDAETIQIRMVVEGLSEAIVGKVQIDGDQLMITSDTGETDVLVRVKE